MTAILMLLITWSLFAFNLGHYAEPTVRPEISYDNATTSAEEIFTIHFRTVIVGIYKQSFDNFNEVVHLSEISDDDNFKADVLLGLYDAMSKAHHTDIPFYALDLYNKIETLLNVNSTSLHPAKSSELQRVLEMLLLDTIVPKGSHILESAVYVKGSNLRGTPIEKLLNMLLTTNQTVANLTFGAMVARARWTLPIAELTPILAYLSANKKQNVDLLLSLYDEGPYQEAEKNIISMHLEKLEKKLDNAQAITAESESKIGVNTTTELESPLLNLLNGNVCFYQELSTGKRRYIHECENDKRMCFYEYDEGQRYKYKARFNAELIYNSIDFNFRSLNFNNRGMSTLLGYNYVFSLQQISKWRAQVKGEQVVLRDMYSNSFLCADNEDERYVHIRAEYKIRLYQDDCKWFVEDCSGVGYY